MRAGGRGALLWTGLLIGSAVALAGTGASGFAWGGCEPVEGSFANGGLCPRDDGLYSVIASDGRFLGPTHGPDPVGVEPDLSDAQVSLTPRTPACKTGLPQEHYALVIYARAFDHPDDYANQAPLIRAAVELANGIVYDAGQAAAGIDVDIRVHCTAGQITVVDQPLPTSKDGDSYLTIFNDLNNLGYDDHRVKYWVFYDDTTACSCGGIALLWADDTPLATNLNNGNPAAAALAGGMIAIDFGRTGTNGARILLHEWGHNVGAVQNSAPHTTQGFHCTDGYDIMCYNDGALWGHLYTNTVCGPWPGPFDCNNDDYFHPNPAPGSYLSTHWNVGSVQNRFIEHGLRGQANLGY